MDINQLQDIKARVNAAGGILMSKATHKDLWAELFQAYQQTYAIKGHAQRPKDKLKTSCSCRFRQAINWLNTF